MRYRDEFFHVAIFASPSAWRSFPYSPRVLAINDLAWMSTVFSFIPHRTTFIRQDVFSSIKVNRVKPVHGSDKSLDPKDVPLIIDAAFLFNIQILACSSGYVNAFQWSRE